MMLKLIEILYDLNPHVCFVVCYIKKLIFELGRSYVNARVIHSYIRENRLHEREMPGNM